MDGLIVPATPLMSTIGRMQDLTERVQQTPTAHTVAELGQVADVAQALADAARNDIAARKAAARTADERDTSEIRAIYAADPHRAPVKASPTPANTQPTLA